MLTPTFGPILPPVGHLGSGSLVEETAEVVASRRECTSFTDLIMNGEEEDDVRGEEEEDVRGDVREVVVQSVPPPAVKC